MSNSIGFQDLPVEIVGHILNFLSPNPQLSRVSKLFKEANEQRLFHEWDDFFSKRDENKPIDYFISHVNQNFPNTSSLIKIKHLYLLIKAALL